MAHKGNAAYLQLAKKQIQKDHEVLLLTRDDPVSILQSMEVVHKLVYRNSKGLEQTRVLKESVGNLEHDTRKTNVDHLISVEIYMCFYCCCDTNHSHSKLLITHKQTFSNLLQYTCVFSQLYQFQHFPIHLLLPD